MAELYIDEATRRRIVKTWVVVCLWFLHLWATGCVAAAIWGKYEEHQSDMLAAMFSTSVTGIGLTLGLLLLDKAADMLLPKLFSKAASVTETITRTVEPTQPTEIKAADVNMSVEGDVNLK